MTSANQSTLPLLPLRDVVMFPMIVIPLMVGRAKSLAACEAALAQDRRILLVAQKQPPIESPAADDLYSVGTTALVIRHLPITGGHMKLLVQGQQRVMVSGVVHDGPFITGVAQTIPDDEGELAVAGCFSAPDWPFETALGWNAAGAAHVATLQQLLEDSMLTTAERLKRAAGFMDFGQP